ncbi:MAG: hypothetical protein HPY66_0531 [Firmicutes bacterium]|nr:hypothetical protein [Bacillota bacterium]
MKDINSNREFLKSLYWDRWDANELEKDQDKGIAQPAPQKPYADGDKLIDLISPDDFTVGEVFLKDVIKKRRSRRKYSGQPLSLEELSFMLWSTQGLSGDKPNLRNAPSAGGRHPFETYLYISNVIGLEPGLYRYLPLEHKLVVSHGCAESIEDMSAACHNQKFVKNSAVVFIWTAVPYRAEWRYSIIAHKMIAIDVGHLCQNLYLASEAVGAGTCAIGKYDQGKMDALLGVDGSDEFAIYAATVGKME